jgi:membrane-associated phospholipid phosphatase
MRERQAVRPLLPPSARPAAGLILACCIVVVAVTGAFAWRSSHGDAVDRPVDSWIRNLFAADHEALHLVSELGGRNAVVVLTLAVIAGCLLAGQVAGAALAAISLPVTSCVVELVLKPLVHETISGSATFPSGHTASTIALAAVIAVLLANPPRGRPSRPARVVIAAAAGCVAFAVGIAMVGLGFHYFTDVIAGAAVGTGVVLATAFLLDAAAVRRWLAALPGGGRRPQAGPRPPEQRSHPRAVTRGIGDRAG